MCLIILSAQQAYTEQVFGFELKSVDELTGGAG